MPTTDFKVHDGLLAVQQTSEGRRLRISLDGEMDLANAETAATTLREALLRGEDVVLDLGKLEFVDSTGVAMLVAAMRDWGERLTFLPSEHDAVRRLLSLTGLDERMRFAAPATRTNGAGDGGPLMPAA
ncbi:MAG TPA: STAS domain-containing protein [Solirubrobacterales bacterium]|nr:STAS domain-containing protein [Solirubrobacterales bacterium]